MPASYILQQELIRVGRVCHHGGFADVSDGEYLGRPVAVKCLKMEGDSDRIFKVFAVSPVRPRRSVSTVALQGDHQLEAPDPPKHTAFVGSFSVRRLMLFPDYYRVDAQRKYATVCKIQSRDKPVAIGVSVCYLSSNCFYASITFSSLTSRLAWLTSTNSVLFMEISKGQVRPSRRTAHPTDE